MLARRRNTRRRAPPRLARGAEGGSSKKANRPRKLASKKIWKKSLLFFFATTLIFLTGERPLHPPPPSCCACAAVPHSSGVASAGFQVSPIPLEDLGGRNRVHSYNAEELRLLLGTPAPGALGAVTAGGMSVPTSQFLPTGPQTTQNPGAQRAAAGLVQGPSSQVMQQPSTSTCLVDELGLQFLPPVVGAPAMLSHAAYSHGAAPYDPALAATVSAAAEGFLTIPGGAGEAGSKSARQSQLLKDDKASNKPRKPKPPSHARSEKARRDRINDNIETLKELVPIHGPNDKASVLEQTADYVRQMQVRVTELEAQCAKMGLGAGPVMNGSGMGMGMGVGGEDAAFAAAAVAAAAAAAANAAANAAACNPLVAPAASSPPTASGSETTSADASMRERSPSMNALEAVRAVPSPATNGDGQPTVTVEESDQAGGMVIKVVCPDRRGLLQAILGVMRKLGLDVTRAVIATPDCGNVDDTFEVQQGDTACDKERIRSEVLAALATLDAYKGDYEALSAQLGKRVKPDPESGEDPDSTGGSPASGVPTSRSSGVRP